jgi:two-component system response regulator YesN
MQRPATIDSNRALLEDAMRVVEERYGSELTLDQVAHEIASSRRQLQRVFAEVGGTTFRSYLAGVRMRHAAELLAGDESPVAAIAAMVGYRQPAQFAKAFRRHSGSAPSAFRAGAPPSVDAPAEPGLPA